MIKIKLETPKEILEIVKKFQENNFEIYLVGGCVRDLVLGKTPNDWDMTTNALPEQIEEIFEHTFYENDFGTVGVVNDEISEKIKNLKKKIVENKKIQEILKKQISEKIYSGEFFDRDEFLKVKDENIFRKVENKVFTAEEKNNFAILKNDFSNKFQKIEKEIKDLKKLEIIEVTPYRTEGKYTDFRRPDEVIFSDKLEDDLKRRDFTVNALAYNAVTEELVDLFGGIGDLREKKIKTVGNPDERFGEDALRILRAVRFTAQLSFKIDEETKKTIIKNHKLLEKVSMERIRDEFVKILLSDNPIEAFRLAYEIKVLGYISKDLERGVGIEQNGAHKYDVFEHLLHTMQHGADRKWSLDIRLSGLFHDISKPETRRWSKEKKNWTFYGHEVVGARVTKKNLQRLKFDNKRIEKITTLVRWHMFFSDPEEITLSAVRRIIRNVGEENIWDLIKLRICDRIGMGRPKEKPYRLRQYEAMMAEAMRSPVSVKDLKINGDQLIADFGMKPGRKIGMILNALMGITLFEPEKNNFEFLAKKVREYIETDEEELMKLAKKGKEKIFEEEKEELRLIKRKHKIK